MVISIRKENIQEIRTSVFVLSINEYYSSKMVSRAHEGWWYGKKEYGWLVLNRISKSIYFFYDKHLLNSDHI